MPPQSYANRTDVERPQEPALDQREAPTPFLERVQAGVRTGAEDQWRNRMSGWREAEWIDRLYARHYELERLSGKKLPLSDEVMRWEAGPEASRDGLAGIGRAIDDVLDAPARLLGREVSIADYEQTLAELKASNPALARIRSRDELWAAHDAELRGVRARAQAAGQDGAGGVVGSFIGGTAAALTDPVNLGATVATGGIGVGRPLLVRMGQQAGVNIGIEATQAPGRMVEADQFGGPDYTAGEAAGDTVLAGAGGAVFEAAGAGGRALLRRLAGARGSAEPIERGLADHAERLMADEAAIGPAADDFDAARTALIRGEPRPVVEADRGLDALFADAQPTGVSGGVRRSQPEIAAPASDLVSAEYRGRRIWSGRFDPLSVETDAARFQYKAEADGEGVTGRLRGVERWDATASGKAILFEERGGRVLVADGHQRRGLARRLAEQGWEDAQLDGYLFREADGWSPREVRVVAALKNVREGSGTIMDAAKLFRDAPQALQDRSLPITGEFIQSARQLSLLGDDAFRAVVNGVIPERYGAALGELAPDRPDLQGDLVALLKRADPGSIDGARALIHEAMLDDFIATEGVQQDLFGGLPREATVIARGRIREAVMAGLRKDTRLYGSLVRHADAIEAGGNALARSENEARLGIDRAAAELVSKLSLRSGDMGEAFQAAARDVTIGAATAGQAAKGLIQRIRSAVAAGERLDELRAETLTPTAPGEAALEAVRAFDEPAGPGARAQLAEKPEDAALEAEAASGGLFDDLPQDEGLDRAVTHLRACAPGRA